MRDVCVTHACVTRAAHVKTASETAAKGSPKPTSDPVRSMTADSSFCFHCAVFDRPPRLPLPLAALQQLALPQLALPQLPASKSSKF